MPTISYSNFHTGPGVLYKYRARTNGVVPDDLSSTFYNSAESGAKTFPSNRPVKPTPEYLYPTAANGFVSRRQYLEYCIINPKATPGSVYYTHGSVSPIAPTLVARDLSGECGTKVRTAFGAQAMQLGEIIGEYKETVSLFKEAAQLMYEAFSLRKGKIPPRWARLGKRWTKSTRNKRAWTARDVSAAWIAGHFAVAPTLGNLNGVCFQFSELVSATGNSATIRVSKSVSQSDSKSYTTGGASGYDIEEYLTSKCRIVAYATINLETPNFNYGNPLEWVWAAIPFSFVVDWMFNVGATLNAFTAMPGYTNVIGTRIDSTDAVVTSNRRYYATPTAIYMPEKSGVYSMRSWNRKVITSIPLPSLPSFKPAGLQTLPTAFALLHLLRR